MRANGTTRDLWTAALLAGLAVLAAGCSLPGAREVETIEWPPGDQIKRIRLVELYVDAADVEVSPLFLRRFWTWFSGGAGSYAEGRMEQPKAVVANNGVVYVADSERGLIHGFDKAERRYLVGRLDGEKKMGEPVGLAVGPEGRIYVTDSKAAKIYVFSADLDYQGLLKTAVRFERPTGIWYDAARKRFYVVDTSGSFATAARSGVGLGPSLTALNLDGSVEWQVSGWGKGNGKFNFPTYVCQRGGKIYLVDSLNYRVQIFDTNGKFLSTFGKQGRARGEFSTPKGIGVDTQGHIYVVDSEFCNVQIFRDDGTLLLYFGEPGGTGREHRNADNQGRFSLPVGLYVSDDNRIYVADVHNRRIQVFQFLGGDR